MSSLQLLTSLAEESDRLEWSRRQKLAQSLHEIFPSVLALVQMVFSCGLAAALPANLSCLHSWLKLDPTGKGECCLSPGELSAAAPHLITVLIGLMGSPEAGTGTFSAGEIISTILSPGKTGAHPEMDHEALKVRFYCQSHQGGHNIILIPNNQVPTPAYHHPVMSTPHSSCSSTHHTIPPPFGYPQPTTVIGCFKRPLVPQTGPGG